MEKAFIFVVSYIEEKYPKTIYFSRNCATVKFLPRSEDYK